MPNGECIPSDISCNECFEDGVHVVMYLTWHVSLLLQSSSLG